MSNLLDTKSPMNEIKENTDLSKSPTINSSGVYTHDLINIFSLPIDVRVDEVKTNKDLMEANISISNLPVGFGITLGNSIRRILLSYLEGCAITSVKFSNIRHEFESIDGVREDIVEIILNLTKVVLKYKGKTNADESVNVGSLNLEVKEPGPIKASMISTDDNVSVVNGNLVLFNVVRPLSLSLDMSYSVGIGYKKFDYEEFSIGKISMQSSFNPIVQSTYSVNEVVGQNGKDVDKLLLNIKTNGSIKPQQAMNRALEILQFSLSSISNVQCEDAPKEEIEHEELPLIDPRFREKVDLNDLSKRAQQRIRDINVVYVGDLAKISRSELYQIDNCGEKTIQDIEDYLKGRGLSLGMNIVGWPPEDLGTEQNKTIESLKSKK
jgi:DNA-directed RNA polymerase subunit alpha